MEGIGKIPINPILKGGSKKDEGRTYMDSMRKEKTRDGTIGLSMYGYLHSIS